MDHSDEPGALALWCAMLPVLRDRAAAGLWTGRLERAENRVRNGASALRACEQFGLIAQDGAPGDSTRGAGSGDVVVVPGLDPVPLAGGGDYRCPARRCPRRDERDATGRPPRCTLFDEPMLPVARA
ncbi:hypothetical protein LZ318_06820 [Saccharopolyspora indica]|uniref:hypothetical protein n=1 Tax=Saccharopolyspora indica TaxID=1229659 RepID=UPI0022EB2F06|nr:hypothetical protein [Saccharopolyspora indica]MDA3647860.1 hypothetical protein [Saccharopolyspora indica]